MGEHVSTDSLYGQADKYGRELARTYGVIWEEWEDNRGYATKIIQFGNAEAAKLARQVHPLGAFLRDITPKAAVGCLAPIAFVSPLATSIAIANIFYDQFGQGIFFLIGVSILLTLWLPLQALKLGQEGVTNKFTRLQDGIFEVILDAAKLEIERLKFGGESFSPEGWAESVGGAWIPKGPKPSPSEHDLTPSEAENYAAAWMSFLGADDVEVTQYSQDGGLDVVSNSYVAQVKHYSNPVSVQPVREIYGVAASMGKQACFFAKNGYTKDAKAFAEAVGMPLFQYSQHSGDIYSCSTAATLALTIGL